MLGKINLARVRNSVLLEEDFPGRKQSNVKILTQKKLKKKKKKKKVNI